MDGREGGGTAVHALAVPAYGDRCDCEHGDEVVEHQGPETCVIAGLRQCDVLKGERRPGEQCPTGAAGRGGP
jgi:hypothetical protein